MGPWDTVEEVVEEEIDIFAELGALKPVTAPVPSTHGATMMTTSNDPLAAFMDDDEEETLTADSLFSLEDVAFEAVIAVMVKEQKKYAEKKDYPFDDKKKKKKDETNKDEETEKKTASEDEVEEVTPDFDAVESTEATLIESEPEDLMGATRASVAEWLTNHVLTK